MYKRVLLAAVLMGAVTGAIARDTYVAPHVRRDGTLVEGHMRSTPNAHRYDNLGSQNNVYGGTNPYTGQRGTQRDEFSSPPVFNPQPQQRRNCVRDVYGKVSCF